MFGTSTCHTLTLTSHAACCSLTYYSVMLLASILGLDISQRQASRRPPNLLAWLKNEIHSVLLQMPNWFHYLLFWFYCHEAVTSTRSSLSLFHGILHVFCILFFKAHSPYNSTQNRILCLALTFVPLKSHSHGPQGNILRQQLLFQFLWEPLRIEQRYSAIIDQI